MFLRIILFCLCFGLSTLVQGQYSIGTPESITNGDDSYGYRNPKVALDSNGDLIVFWMRTGNDEAFFISKKNTSGFTDPIEVSFDGYDPDLWSGSLGPNIASGGGHVYVTFEVYGDAIYIIHSGDDGITWDDPIEAFVPPADRRATIPSIAVNSDGHAFIAYVNTDANEEDAYYGFVKTLDQGLTFSSEVIVNYQTTGAEVCECCNGHVVVDDNGDVFVGYRNNNDNLRDNWLSRSTDGGESFGLYYDMDETDWVAGVCPSSGPHFIIEDGIVLMTFFSAAPGWGSGTYYATVDLSNANISSAIGMPTGDPSSFLQNRPRVANSGEKMIIVSQEHFNGDTDIAMTYSNSGPTGFGNNSAHITTAEGNQQFPQVIAGNDVFHVVYEDLSSNTVMYQEIDLTASSFLVLTNDELELYPNPSDDILNIGVSQEKRFERFVITDIFGRKILDVDASETTMNTSDLEEGTYFFIPFINGIRAGTFKLQVAH